MAPMKIAKPCKVRSFASSGFVFGVQMKKLRKFVGGAISVAGAVVLMVQHW
jgi:hypothetical protein